MIKEIINKATKHGACRLTEGVSTWEELARLLFSPQGVEFCETHTFLTPEDLRRIEAHSAELQKYRIFVNAGEISHEGDGDIALLGETRGEVNFNTCDRISRIILLNGATAKIKASNFAVLDIHRDQQSRYTLTNDQTVVVL